MMERMRERGRTRRGVETVETFSKSQPTRMLFAICVKLHTTAPKIQVHMIRVSRFKI